MWLVTSILLLLLLLQVLLLLLLFFCRFFIFFCLFFVSRGEMCVLECHLLVHLHDAFFLRTCNLILPYKDFVGLCNYGWYFTLKGQRYEMPNPLSIKFVCTQYDSLGSRRIYLLVFLINVHYGI